MIYPAFSGFQVVKASDGDDYLDVLVEPNHQRWCIAHRSDGTVMLYAPEAGTNAASVVFDSQFEADGIAHESERVIALLLEQKKAIELLVAELEKVKR